MSNRMSALSFQPADANGDVLPGAKLGTFFSGTTTPITTYTDADLTIAHSNPIIADGKGEFPEIFLSIAQHRMVLSDANDVQINVYDNVCRVEESSTVSGDVIEVRTASQGQTLFTFTNTYEIGTNGIAVYIQGVFQRSPDNYTETSTNSITFTSGLDAGDEVTVVFKSTPTAASGITAQDITYNQGGTGAVTRTVENRLQEWLSVKDYGAVGDGVADDTSAIQAAINEASSQGVGTVVLSDGFYLVNSNLDVLQNVDLIGTNEYIDFTDRDFWPQVKSAIRLNSSATIQLRNGAGLSSLLVYRSDMTFPPGGLTATEVALYAGTAVTVESASPYIRHCTFLGFERAIDTNVANTPRGRVEFVNIDCTNGIRIDQDLGGWTLNTVLCQPILSDSDADNIRTGIGFEFKNKSDWTWVVNCFTFQDTGFQVDDCNSIKLISCGADHPTDGTDTFHTGTGFRIIGSSSDNMMIACQSASHDRGLEVNTDADLTNYVTNFNAWNMNSSTGFNIIVNSGNVNVIGGRLGRNFSDGGKGLVSLNVNARIFVTGTHFVGLNNALDTPSFAELQVDPSCNFETISGPIQNNEAFPQVASAGAVTLPNNVKVVEITGTTTIGTLVGTNRLPGETVILRITDAAGLTINNGTIQLSGSVNVVMTQNSNITLLYRTGNNWDEVSRMIA